MHTPGRKLGDYNDRALSKDTDAEEEEEGGLQYVPEETEEERLARKRRCLRFFDVCLLLFGGGLCGGALYCATLMYASVGEALMYALAGVGGAIFAINVLGLLSVCTENTRLSALVTYFTFLIFLAFAMLVAGGYCFILTSSAVAYIQDNWNTIVQSLPADKRATLTEADAINTIRWALYGAGGAAVFISLLSVGAMSQAVALLTPSRAYTVFLQATNIAMLPIGVALIAAATFVADTAVAAEAAIAAFSIFILGVFVIVLLLIGCVGTSLQSRGIVRMFMFLTVLLGLAFLVFGVLSLVQSALVSRLITSQWDTLRRVLPPDFGGKYDKEQFEKFIDTNLTALGFLAVCAGVLLLAQFWAAFRLRRELKFESQLEQEAWDAVKKGLLSAQTAETIASTGHSKAQIMWKQQWTKGTKLSRRLIMCGCGTLCALVCIVIGLAVAALYYSTSCTKLGSYAETTVYDAQSLGPYVFIANNYSLGITRVTVDTTLTTRLVKLSLRKAAFRADMAPSTWPAVFQRNTTVTLNSVDVLGTGVGSTLVANGIVAPEKDLSQILGFDVSCQNSEAAVVVPRAAVYHVGLGNTRAAGDAHPLAFDLESVKFTTGVALDFGAVQYPDKPRIRHARMVTASGAVDVVGALFGSKGFAVTTGGGEVSIVDTEAECDPDDIGTALGGLRITTDKGSTTVRNLKSTNCDVSISVTQSLARVVDSTVSNTLGGGTLMVSGAKGVMEISRTVSDVFDLKGEEGSIRVNNITALESIKVATLTGVVSLQQIRLSTRGVVQIESDSGNIDVWATQFRGIISIVTGGSITCLTAGTHGFYGSNPCAVTSGGQVDSTGAQTLRVVEQVAVNCRTATVNNCPYMGQITITSARGNVVLRMDRVV